MELKTNKLTSTILLLILVCLAGCSGGGGGSSSTAPANNTVSGVVQAPSGAHLKASLQADLSGTTPVPGVTVELVTLTPQGAQPPAGGSVLATTTTDASGAYTFSGPSVPAPSSNLAVIVPGQVTPMTAIVTGPEVNITPVSEAVYEALMTEISTSGGSVTLGNFGVGDVAALNNYLLGQNYTNVGSDSFGDAVTAVENTVSTTLTSLVNAFAETNSFAGTVLQDNEFTTVGTIASLEDPLTLGGPGNGGVLFYIGTGGAGFGEGLLTGNTVAGGDEVYSAPIWQNLADVCIPPVSNNNPISCNPTSPNYTLPLVLELTGLTHVISPSGQLLVYNASLPGILASAVAGAVTANGSLMVYPLNNSGTTGIVNIGLRVATNGGPIGSSTSGPPVTNALLDTTGGSPGTSYNLVRFNEALSGPTSANTLNGVTLTTETGTIQFLNPPTPAYSFNGQAYGSFTAGGTNGLATNPVTLNFTPTTNFSTPYTVTNGPAGTDTLGESGGGFYQAIQGGTVFFRDNAAAAYLGSGGAITTNGSAKGYLGAGEVVTLSEAANGPVGTNAGATSDAATNALLIAIRQTATTPVVSGTYNLVQYEVDLTGDGVSDGTVQTVYQFGNLILDGSGDVTGGNILDNRASLDIPTAISATSNALSQLPTTTISPQSGTYVVNNHGTMTLTLTVGSTQITGSGAVTSNGELIVLAIQSANGANQNESGRGLLFLVRQPD